MNQSTTNVSPETNEAAAARAFSAQSVMFDEQYRPNTIIQYKRQRVRSHVVPYLPVVANILELNAGTGEDAIFFAQQGHKVHATDISTGMQNILEEKVRYYNLAENVTHELCSFTQLEELKARGPYDLIFSNFAGLNCTGQLDKVLSSFSDLLKPGGTVTLVLLPGFCLWEFLLIFKGRIRTAFRRLLAAKGAPAHVEGEYFTCYYYHPSYISNTLKDSFDLMAVEGLCTIVPPSYIEHFAEKRPRLYHWMTRMENRLKSKWPWRNIGDYYIVTLKKKDVG